jgi:dihydrofolate reductase
MERPRVSVYLALSLDGYIAREDGGLDWLERMQVPGEDYGYAEFYGGVDALVLGRRTYDAVLDFPDWPFDGKRVVVLTHRPLRPRHGERAHAGALEPLLRELAREGARRVYLDGGNAVRGALAEGLVDDLTLSWVPVVLGRGRPLFDRSLLSSEWQLAGSRAFSTGLVQCRYHRRRT